MDLKFRIRFTSLSPWQVQVQVQVQVWNLEDCLCPNPGQNPALRDVLAVEEDLALHLVSDHEAKIAPPVGDDAAVLGLPRLGVQWVDVAPPACG